ncbi:hypothetical protein M422DRAFT_248326 [Sphaerobolus stellatus SS14]|uniref:Uncharacterized protein n=1 Tax=Sphaerobolus stellatus (strain SS14) TaxID=990650 RepID=A0A0C9V7R9_SPHS4|nr:hypothetical protein M422DRAFT_259980 [Sphaerobolus stellatus SS14]KIJ47764.1 hypothetical protein M422DRAFT_248326 [Sphaerobolus stellatus SS14]
MKISLEAHLKTFELGVLCGSGAWDERLRERVLPGLQRERVIPFSSGGMSVESEGKGELGETARNGTATGERTGAGPSTLRSERPKATGNANRRTTRAGSERRGTGTLRPAFVSAERAQNDNGEGEGHKRKDSLRRKERGCGGRVEGLGTLE